MTLTEREQMYFDFLAEEGYRPELAEPGHVAFKKDGLFLIIMCHEEDEGFFHLFCPDFWPYKGARERNRVYRAAAEVTAGTKCLKVFPLRGGTFASVEIFCSPPDAFKAVFDRALASLAVGLDRFQEAMDV